MSANPIAVLIYEIIQDIRARSNDRRPALIGVAGAQGCGKSYLCQLLEAANRGRFAHFSLDDVYLRKLERDAKARQMHPLLATRGAPGTHDLELARRVIEALNSAQDRAETRLPRFDKRADDRAPDGDWPVFRGKPEAILFDGWCVGALPDELGPAPVNRLEADQDGDGRWRTLVGGELATTYQAFFDRFDAIVYLQAPDWEIVRSWRGQQEEQTLGRKLSALEEARLDGFLMFYERITKSMMAGRHRATHLVKLGKLREPLKLEIEGNPH